MNEDLSRVKCICIRPFESILLKLPVIEITAARHLVHVSTSFETWKQSFFFFLVMFFQNIQTQSDFPMEHGRTVTGQTQRDPSIQIFQSF